MELVGAVAQVVLAALVPLGAVLLADRILDGKLPPGRAWQLRLRGEAPPYPAKDVGGHLVMGERLLWVADSGAGEIDLTRTGLYAVRSEPPTGESPRLVCVDGLGTGLRLSGGTPELERELRQHPMPENPLPPSVAGPRGRVFGGPPALGLVLGALLVAGLVVFARRGLLDPPPGQLLFSTASLTALFVLPPSVVGFLVVRPRTHLRMRRALAVYRRARSSEPDAFVPEPRTAPVAFVVPPAHGELSWEEAAELVRRRAEIEEWQRVGKASAHRPLRWWQDVLFGLLLVVSALAGLVWSGSVPVTDVVDGTSGRVAAVTAFVLCLGLWFSHRKEDAGHRRLLASPPVTTPYVLAPDPTSDTNRTLLLVAAREIPDSAAGYDGWLRVPLTRDQRRLPPAGWASLHGQVAPGERVAVVIDDLDRATDWALAVVDDDEVRRLVTALDVPTPRLRRRRRKTVETP